MICFQISIFEPLETTAPAKEPIAPMLWFAFKLVSLNHWKQPWLPLHPRTRVVICFQISIFEPLETTQYLCNIEREMLWFAFKLVSLNHWKQLFDNWERETLVVICFQISIFEPLETTGATQSRREVVLWFAFKLVSLNHWKQLREAATLRPGVVICFQISIFEPLETTIAKVYV